jgi:hypothetical protein
MINRHSQFSQPSQHPLPDPRTPRCALSAAGVASRTATRAALAIVATAAASLSLAGCGEEEAPPPPPVVVAPPPPPPPPPPPAVKSIAELMQELGIDPRVKLAESDAPNTTEKRIAVLLFWHNFATGDAEKAGKTMSDEDKLTLQALVANGAWPAITSQIEQIEVVCADDGAKFATMGIVRAGDDESPMLWDCDMSLENGFFMAFPATPDIMEQLSGADQIAAWRTYIKELLAKADLPDEIIEIAQEDVQTTSVEGSSGGSGGGGGTGAGAPKMRRPVPKDPVKVPQGPPGGPGR